MPVCEETGISIPVSFSSVGSSESRGSDALRKSAVFSAKNSANGQESKIL